MENIRLRLYGAQRPIWMYISDEIYDEVLYRLEDAEIVPGSCSQILHNLRDRLTVHGEYGAYK